MRPAAASSAGLWIAPPAPRVRNWLDSACWISFEASSISVRFER
jgi:hypothetical protein